MYICSLLAAVWYRFVVLAQCIETKCQLSRMVLVQQCLVCMMHVCICI